MSHPQILAATKNKDGNLDNHKSLRHNQELGAELIDEICPFHETILSKLGEVVVLSQKPTQTVKEKKKTKELEKEQTIPKDSRRKKIKMRVDVNEIETQKAKEKIDKTKSWFFSKDK